MSNAEAAVAAVLELHKPATRHHEKYNNDGTLITYTTTQDGPCVTCHPLATSLHCMDCEDDDCDGVREPRQPWPCATYKAATDALKEES